jgi:hypothetical protein
MRAMLTRNPAEARRLMESLLKGPVRFEPSTDEHGSPRFLLSGTIATGALFHNLSDPNGKPGLVNQAAGATGAEMEFVKIAA